MSQETADRFRKTAARWIHRNRPGNNSENVDCDECFEAASAILESMDAAMGGAGTTDLVALVAELQRPPSRWS